MTPAPGNSSLAEPLAELRGAFQAGRRARASLPAGANSDAEIAQVLLARLPVAAQLALRLSGGPRSEALQAARAGDFLRAVDAIRRAETAYGSRTLTRQAVLVAASLDAAAAAYVDYRAERYPDAWRRTLDALLTTNSLEADCGFMFMEQRRVHLVTNLVHMEVRRGRAREAMALAWPLLSYIEGDDGAWLMSEVSGGVAREPRKPTDELLAPHHIEE